jgi:hypothetical protein
LLEGRVCRIELGFPSQAAHLGHGRFLDYFGQAFDGDVAAVTQPLLQTVQRPDEQAVAEPADELTDPLVACLAGLVLTQRFLAAQVQRQMGRFISGSDSSWAMTSVAMAGSRPTRR